jgi:hypothetical protein
MALINLSPRHIFPTGQVEDIACFIIVCLKACNAAAG